MKGVCFCAGALFLCPDFYAQSNPHAQKMHIKKPARVSRLCSFNFRLLWPSQMGLTVSYKSPLHYSGTKTTTLSKSLRTEADDTESISSPAWPIKSATLAALSAGIPSCSAHLPDLSFRTIPAGAVSIFVAYPRALAAICMLCVARPASRIFISLLLVTETRIMTGALALSEVSASCAIISGSVITVMTHGCSLIALAV